eukprot:11864257-Alexandrium_andersonii.AAC.1
MEGGGGGSGRSSMLQSSTCARMHVQRNHARAGACAHRAYVCTCWHQAYVGPCVHACIRILPSSMCARAGDCPQACVCVHTCMHTHTGHRNN